MIIRKAAVINPKQKSEEMMLQTKRMGLQRGDDKLVVFSYALQGLVFYLYAVEKRQLIRYLYLRKHAV